MQRPVLEKHFRALLHRESMSSPTNLIASTIRSTGAVDRCRIESRPGCPRKTLDHRAEVLAAQFHVQDGGRFDPTLHQRRAHQPVFLV